MNATMKVTTIALALAAGLVLTGVPDVQAASASGPRGKNPGMTPGKTPGKTPPAPRVGITTAALQAARPLYQKNLNRLMRTRSSAQTPQPAFHPGPAGSQPMALPGNQPRKARTWSMTATRGERNSIISSRTYSSGSMSDTNTSASSASSSSTSR